MPKLFFVRADSVDGENLDLLVRADNKAEAKSAWDKHYNEGDPDGHTLSCIEWAGEVPVVGPKGAIDWDLVNPRD